MKYLNSIRATQKCREGRGGVKGGEGASCHKRASCPLPSRHKSPFLPRKHANSGSVAYLRDLHDIEQGACPPQTNPKTILSRKSSPSRRSTY
ncbi:hypothetical protein EVAR_12818_1 [Eumeta japonica]|uniref:Uncharacterized protein n=1 Tax=Eumeta variegata TaxID=151549 RepID=A0A4C1UBN7_EUMVA|nr:hypothetical protein EVAR_12818_1 [Eumeta japonica]